MKLTKRAIDIRRRMAKAVLSTTPEQRRRIREALNAMQFTASGRLISRRSASKGT
jgi:hypothetical protein